ncbi:hypothetical protein NIES2101_27460 [Calothrix sp. HK-06]|nr:hypothetical protein NIES2101_27460 [Calothrix sp. HK-06]
MPRSVSYHDKLIQDLKDPLEATAYIEVALEENEPKFLSKAIKNVIEAQVGLSIFRYLPNAWLWCVTLIR